MSQEIDLAWSRQIRINHVSPLSDNHPPCSYSLQLGKFRFQIRPGDICPMISRFRNFFVFVKFENLSEILRNIYIRIACIGSQLLAVFFFVFADTHRSWQLALNQLGNKYYTTTINMKEYQLVQSIKMFSNSLSLQLY